MSAAWAMMIQMSPLFWGNQDMVLETSEQIDKFKEWDKLPALRDLAQRLKRMASAFSNATKVTLKVDDLVLHLCPAEYAHK